MFEEIVSNAVQMLIVLLWVTMVFIVISGAFWVRTVKKA
jgi:hypothetical protein